MAYHDFEKINDIPIADVCKKLDIKLEKERRAKCFMHDDRHPSLTIYKATNSWFCYTCNKGGGVIDLVKDYFHYDTDKASKWLEVEFNISPKPTGWKWKKVKSPKITTDKESGKIEVDSEILEWIIANTTLTPLAHKFLDEERKIKKEVYERLNIRSLDDARIIEQLKNQFDIKRLLENHIISEGKYGYILTWNTPCLLFPFYDSNGKLVNIQSRYLKPIIGKYPPRFRFIKDSKTSLYNVSALNSIAYGDAVLVTEGVTDALAALSAGIKTVVAVAGVSAFKEEYVDMLCDYTIFICPDNDKPGKNLLKDIKEKMGKRLGVVKEIQLADGSKDIGDYFAAHEELRFG